MYRKHVSHDQCEHDFSQTRHHHYMNYLKQDRSVKLHYHFSKRQWNEATVSENQSQTEPAITEKKTEDFHLDLNDFKIYPNPADNQLNVSFSIDTPGPVEIKILDGIGRVVVEDSFTTDSGYVNREYNIEGKAKGTYLLQIRQGDKWKHEKIILK